MTVKPLRPFFSYLGSKWRLAPRYPAPEQRTIIEPFAGSAGYSLHYWDRKVVLYDTNPIVAGLWKYLINVSKEEILSIPLLEDGQSVDDLKVCQEAKWLVGFWINPSVAKPSKHTAAFGECISFRYGWRNPSGSRLKWELWVRKRISSGWDISIRNRTAAQLPAIRHWEIHEKSYLESPNATATRLIDPPYQSLAACYNTPPINYQELADWCRTRVGFTVVCEEQGADWLPFQVLRKRSSTMKRRKKSYSEVVWINRRGEQ